MSFVQNYFFVFNGSNSSEVLGKVCRQQIIYSQTTYLVMNQCVLVVFVAIGGAVGALARFGLEELFSYVNITYFPYDILIANFLGSFIMGLLTAATKKQLIPQQPWNSLVMTGFLGALTTFSTYAMDDANFIMQQNALLSTLNILVTAIVGIFLAWAGYQLVFQFAHKPQPKVVIEIDLQESVRSTRRRQMSVNLVEKTYQK